MTTSLSAPAAAENPPASGPRRRRKWTGIAVCVVLVAAACVGLGFWRYAATYAPQLGGDFSGPYHVVGQPDVMQRDTDLGTELYVAGPAGTEAQWITDMTNEGSRGTSRLT